MEKSNHCAPSTRKLRLGRNRGSPLDRSPNRKRDGDGERQQKKKQRRKNETEEASCGQSGNQKIILGCERQRGPVALETLGALKGSRSPRAVVNPFTQTQNACRAQSVKSSRPCEVPGDVVFFWPLPFQERFRDSVMELLLPV